MPDPNTNPNNPADAQRPVVDEAFADVPIVPDAPPPPLEQPKSKYVRGQVAVDDPDANRLQSEEAAKIAAKMKAEAAERNAQPETKAINDRAADLRQKAGYADDELDFDEEMDNDADAEDRRAVEAERIAAEKVVQDQKKKDVRQFAREREEKENDRAQSTDAIWEYLEELTGPLSTESKDEPLSLSDLDLNDVEKTIKKALREQQGLQESFEQLRSSLLAQGRNFDSLNLNFKSKSDNDKEGSGTLVATNAPALAFVDIDALIAKACLDCNLDKKIKVKCYSITDEKGQRKLNLVWHANSGAANIIEIKVIDQIVHALLAQGNKSVQVSALTHRNAYQQDAKGNLVKDEYGHMVWDSAFVKMLKPLTGFERQKITNLSVSQRVTEKTRGALDENNQPSAVDILPCPQWDRAGLKVNDANMVTWTAVALQPDEKIDNSSILESMVPPSIKQVVDFNTGKTNFSAHTPVISEDKEVSWVLAADMSRKGKKAFKAREDIYEAKALEDLPALKKKRQVLVMNLFMGATNTFLAADKKTWTDKQMEAFKILRDLLRDYQDNKTVIQPLCEESFTNFSDGDAVRAFTRALNNLIATQVGATTKEVENEKSLAHAWLNVLEQWKNSQAFKTFASHLKPEQKKPDGAIPQPSQAPQAGRPATSAPTAQLELTAVRLRPVAARGEQKVAAPRVAKGPKKHPTKMTAEELRELSCTETASGGFDPIKMLLADFGCEESSGYWAINGSTTETNESMGRHQLHGKIRLVLERMFRSSKPVVISVIEGADSERSPAEIANKSIMVPSDAIPHVLAQVVEALKIFDRLIPVQMNQFAAESKGAPASGESKETPPSAEPAGETGHKPGPKPLARLFADMRVILTELETTPNPDGTRRAKNSAEWTVADNTQHLMFTHFIREANSVLKAELKKQKQPKNRLSSIGTGLFGSAKDPKNSTEQLIVEAGDAIIDFQNHKDIYLQIKNSGTKDCNLKGLEKNYLDAQKKVNVCCDKMKTRTGWQNFRNVCLVMAGIVLVAAAVSLLVMSFGGFAPLSAGLATLGIYISASTAQGIAAGCFVGAALTIPAYRNDFFGKSERYKFAEHIEKDVQTVAAVK